MLYVANAPNLCKMFYGRNYQAFSASKVGKWMFKKKIALARTSCSHTTEMQQNNNMSIHEKKKKWKCTKLKNASQQTTLIMINMPNKWTLKISSVLSLSPCAFSGTTFGHVMFLLFLFCFIIFLIAFIGISLHNALCDLFLSCCSLHDYFLSIHLPFGCIMKWRPLWSTFFFSLFPVRFVFRERSLRTNVITPTFIYSLCFFFSIRYSSYLAFISFALDRSHVVTVNSGKKKVECQSCFHSSLEKLTNFPASVSIRINFSKANSYTKFSHTETRFRGFFWLLWSRLPPLSSSKKKHHQINAKLT